MHCRATYSRHREVTSPIQHSHTGPRHNGHRPQGRHSDRSRTKRRESLCCCLTDARGLECVCSRPHVSRNLLEPWGCNTLGVTKGLRHGVAADHLGTCDPQAVQIGCEGLCNPPRLRLIDRKPEPDERPEGILRMARNPAVAVEDTIPHVFFA